MNLLLDIVQLLAGTVIMVLAFHAGRKSGSFTIFMASMTTGALLALFWLWILGAIVVIGSTWLLCEYAYSLLNEFIFTR